MKKICLTFFLAVLLFQNGFGFGYVVSVIYGTYGCNNGSITITINPDPLFNFYHIKCNPNIQGCSPHDLCPVAASTSTPTQFTFSNLCPGEYHIEVWPLIALPCVHALGPFYYQESYNWVLQWTCDYPTVTAFKNESFPGCADGWIDVSTGDHFPNLSAGNHTVTGSYDCYCSLDLPYTVPQSITTTGCQLGMSYYLNQPVINCNGASVDINLSGGYNVSQYSYELVGVNNSNYYAIYTSSAFYSFSNVPAGDYYLLAAEYRNGAPGSCYCLSYSDTFSIHAPAPTFIVPVISPVNITTHGCNNGKITIAAQNYQNGNFNSATWPSNWWAQYTAFLYSPTWTLISQTPFTQNTEFANLSPGTYNVVLTGQRHDAVFCVSQYFNLNIAITQPACNLNLQASATSSSQYNCDDGAITASIQNYTDDCSPALYLFDNNNVQVDEWNPATGTLPVTWENLLPGSYTVTAYAGDCFSQTLINVPNGPCDIIFDAIVNDGLHGCNNSSIEITDYSNICADVNYVYHNLSSPFDSGAFVLSNDVYTTASNLHPGNYLFTATVDTCTLTQNILVSNPPCTMTVNATVTYNGTCSGKICGNISDNCSQVLCELRKANNTLVKSTITNNQAFCFDTLNAGNYKVIVYDAGGCSASKTVSVTGLSCSAPAGMAFSVPKNKKVTLTWNLVPCAIGYTIQYRKQGVTTWTTAQINSNINSKTISNLLINTIYEWHIRTKCTPTFTSAYSSIAKFCATLGCSAKEYLAENYSNDIGNINIYPNPVTDLLNVEFDVLPNQINEVSITDVTGKKLKMINEFQDGENILLVDVSNLASGIYFVNILSREQSITMRFLKQ